MFKRRFTALLGTALALMTSLVASDVYAAYDANENWSKIESGKGLNAGKPKNVLPEMTRYKEGTCSIPLRGYLDASYYAHVPKGIEVTGYFAVCRRYVHPPRVTWKPIEGAVRYQLILFQGNTLLGVTDSTQAACQAATGWNKIKPGMAAVVIQAFNQAGNRIALSRMLPFYVAPGFSWKTASKQKRPYREAAMKAFDALLNMKVPGAPTEGPGSKMLPAVLTCVEGASSSYPVLHDWMYVDMVESMLKIADESIRPKLIYVARSAGDHLLMCRLPAEGNAYGNLVRGAADANGSSILGGTAGIQRKEVIEPAKNGYAADALVRVYELTGDAKYLNAAVLIAEVLVKTQSDDGSWPARVDGKTGEVIGSYSTSVAAVASFLDRLNKHRPDERWVKARDRALAWTMQYPMKTNGWVVNFDDVTAFATKEDPYKGEVFSNWDLFYFIRYLCDHPDKVHNPYPAIKEQLEWNDNHFVFYGPDYLLGFNPFYPCCAEQGKPQFYDAAGAWNPMDFHTANWGRALLKVYRLSGDKHWLDLARAAANTLTQYQFEDGRTTTWMCDRTFGVLPSVMSCYDYALFFPAAWSECISLWADLAALESREKP